MHKDGKLGFHAPYYELDKSSKFSAEELADYVYLSNLIISDFLAFGSKRSIFDIKPMLSMSLMSDMLREPSDEVALVDTVEEVARWSIGLDGIPDSRQLGRTDLIRACLNHQAWIRDEKSDVESLSFYISQEDEFITLGQGQSRTRYLKVNTGGMEDQHCLVAIPEGSVSSIDICTYDGFSGLNVGDCSNGPGYYIPHYYSLDPTTPLAKL